MDYAFQEPICHSLYGAFGTGTTGCLNGRILTPTAGSLAIRRAVLEASTRAALSMRVALFYLGDRHFSHFFYPLCGERKNGLARSFSCAM